MKERIRVRLGAETVLVFGPELVSYERSRYENRTILREIPARVFRKKKNTHKNSRKIIFQIFPGYGEIGKIKFPIFPGSD